MFTHMRIARPVTDLKRSAMMYCLGLELQHVGGFNDHDGFNGVMLGRKELGWHMEFTECRHHPVQPLQTEEDLLVLYYRQENEWLLACARMHEAGFAIVPSFNPYWDISGRTFADHDGYRVVLQNNAWPK